MNNEFSTIEDQLTKVSVHTLSHEEKDTLWVSIARAHAERPVVSPYSWMLLVHRRLMVSVSAVLIFVLAGGSTVALADGAKPGDTLFVLDRATENMVLALTSEKSRDSVRVAIANERVDELEALISDESSRRLARVEIDSNVRAKESSEAGLMMATLAVDTATNTDNGSEQRSPEDARTFSTGEVQDDTSNKDVVAVEKKDRKRSDIEEALSLVDEISSELEKRGNKEGHDSVKRAMKRLSGKFNELPQEDNDTFRESFERVIDEGHWNDNDDSDNDDSDDSDDDDNGTWSNDDGVLSPPNPRPEDIFDNNGNDEDSSDDNGGDGGPVEGGSVQGASIRVDIDVNLDDNSGHGGNDEADEEDDN